MERGGEGVARMSTVHDTNSTTGYPLMVNKLSINSVSYDLPL